MKNLIIFSQTLVVLLFVTSSFTSCDKSNDNVIPDTVLSLSEDETANLRFMREEEKLARDVYLYFHDQYGLNIFNNIASSEQTHMDAVLTIMEKYGVEDPASNDQGIFTNVTLQQMYNDLITQGDVSLVAALGAGATIEDVDIRDLDNVIEATSNTDLIDLYEMLECGSRNHLRAFISQLDRQGGTYTPQFIAQEKFDEIISGAHEYCGK